MKKIYIFSLITILMGCSIISLLKSDTVQEKKPNILLIVADDLGYGDLGIYGSEIETPNINQLAKEGIQFTNFHVGAACSPTRTMLMTGVDNHRAGLGNMLEIQADNQFGQPGYEGYLNHKVTSLATRFKDAGYHTYMAGKWHLGKTEETIPYARGFEKSFALMESGADNWEMKSYAPFYKDIHFYENQNSVTTLPENYFSSDYFSGKIIDFIQSNQEDEKPFFAYVSYQAVHMPHQAPKHFIDKYNGVYDKGWDVIREERFQKQKTLGLINQNTSLNNDFSATSIAQWNLSSWELLTEEKQKYKARQMQAYAGMLDNMDDNIGYILSYLKEIGEYENTIIVFLSDNGADPTDLTDNATFQHWYNTNYDYAYFEEYKKDYSKMGLKGSFSNYGSNWAAVSNTPMSYFKTFSNEGGMRTPLIISYPKQIKKGQKTDAFSYIKDLAPTLLDFCKINYSTKEKEKYAVSGVSMYSFLTDKSDFVHTEEEYIGYELAGSCALFQGNFKLIKNPSPKGYGTWELYNIKDDPSETNNIATDHPLKVEEMIMAYKKYQEENGIIPVPDDYDPLKQLIKNSFKSKH